MLTDSIFGRFPMIFFDADKGGGGGNGDDDDTNDKGKKKNGDNDKDVDDDVDDVDDDKDKGDEDDDLFEELGIDPKDFDPKRALKTIRAQRATEKEAKKTLKELKDKVVEFETAKKEEDDKKRKKEDVLNEKVGKLETENEGLKSTNEKMAVRHAIEITATKSQFGKEKDQRFADPSDAFKMVDLKKIEYDAEESQVTGVLAELKQLASDKPYLLEEQADPKKPPRGTPRDKKQKKGKRVAGQDDEKPDIVKVRF